MNAVINAAILAESNINSVLNNGLSLSEKASLSLKMILIGMGTVFAVLFIIWFFLTVFRLIMGLAKKKKAPAPAAPAPSDGQDPVSDDGELIAAITAAITAYREEDGVQAPSSFRVVSFEKRGTSRPWKKNR